MYVVCKKSILKGGDREDQRDTADASYAETNEEAAPEGSEEAGPANLRTHQAGLDHVAR